MGDKSSDKKNSIRWCDRHLPDYTLQPIAVGLEQEDGSNFIFPILEKGLTPERERQLIQQLTGVINDHMKAIAKKIGIESDCTTYAARHRFSTVLQRSGASTEFISEALGHSSVKTTVNYLAGFEDETKKETVKALMAFKNS